MAKSNSSNALMGARARIATVESELRTTKAKLEDASDACRLYARKADILQNGSERLKDSIKQLSELVNEQAEVNTALDLRVKNDELRMSKLQDKLTHSYVVIGGLSVLVMADVILSVLGY